MSRRKARLRRRALAMARRGDPMAAEVEHHHLLAEQGEIITNMAGLPGVVSARLISFDADSTDVEIVMARPVMSVKTTKPIVLDGQLGVNVEITMDPTRTQGTMTMRTVLELEQEPEDE